MSALTNKIFRNVVAAPALALAAVSLPFAGAVAQDRPVAAQPVAANANVQPQPVAFRCERNDVEAGLIIFIGIDHPIPVIPTGSLHLALHPANNDGSRQAIWHLPG